MGRKPLEWSVRADADLHGIIRFYTETASPEIAALARASILKAAFRLVADPVVHRPGKRGTRECVLRKFPYIVIYRVSPSKVHIIRVLHQARDYFTA